jgi:E3 ubiquitin-protein ligase SIAH1
MEDLPRAMGEVLLKELECPVCMEYMVPPIKLCTNGHNICSKCKGKVNCCPTCRANYSDIRNVALENIARIQKYPCANRKTGCSELFSIEHIAEHQALCIYGDIKCPLQIIGRCSWKGITSDFKKHAEAAHPGNIKDGSALRSILYSATSIYFLSCFGELFVHHEGIRDGILYCTVQLIGTSSEASKYKS